MNSQITNPSNYQNSQNVSNQVENQDTQINNQFEKNEEIQNIKNDIISNKLLIIFKINKIEIKYVR